MIVCHRVISDGGKPIGIMIFCPGCQFGHLFDARWKFNQDFEKPTFTPSYLSRGGEGDAVPRCHFFVADGMIRFLSDCTHKLAGETLPLEWIE